MDKLFSRKWIIATVVAWLFIVLLDELTYATWKQVNPSSQYSGILIKHQLTPSSDQPGGYPNGYRPAGGP